MNGDSMASEFSRIALMGRYGTRDARTTLQRLIQFLKTEQVDIYIEKDTAQILDVPEHPLIAREEVGTHCDLVIVIGGDGSLLSAARAVAEYNTPVIGINRGTVGFLTDISPAHLERSIGDILNGQYIEEKRFLLSASIERDHHIQFIGDALNDVVLYAGEVARMIEFELYIDGDFVYSQRSDGLIIATPTGSTAYALSGGGPIVHPSLEAIVLVPMFPHTLTSRPIVVNSHSTLELSIAPQHSELHPGVSCDGQQVVPLLPGAKLKVHRKETSMRLIHPLDYDYYHTLRSKLEWGSKLHNKHMSEHDH